MATAAAAGVFFSTPSPHPLLRAGHRNALVFFHRDHVLPSPSPSRSPPPPDRGRRRPTPKYNNACHSRLDAGEEDVDGVELAAVHAGVGARRRHALDLILTAAEARGQAHALVAK
jgi:hypothetical protein